MPINVRLKLRLQFWKIHIANQRTVEYIKEKNYTVLSGGTDWNLEAELNFKKRKYYF